MREEIFVLLSFKCKNNSWLTPISPPPCIILLVCFILHKNIKRLCQGKQWSILTRTGNPLGCVSSTAHKYPFILTGGKNCTHYSKSIHFFNGLFQKHSNRFPSYFFLSLRKASPWQLYYFPFPVNLFCACSIFIRHLLRCHCCSIFYVLLFLNYTVNQGGMG